jgi:hypothetical protein
MMNIDWILPLSITIALLSWTLVFLWYVHPWSLARPLEEALRPILLLHAFRYVGLMFLIPGVTNAALDPRFAVPAAYGDLAAALLALGALFMLTLDRRLGIAMVWVFNIWGLLDLINAVARGITYTPDGDLGATFWIPATIVPLLLVSHVWVFVVLLKRGKDIEAHNRGEGAAHRICRSEYSLVFFERAFSSFVFSDGWH